MKLIQGKEYYLSDISESDAIKNKLTREFACYAKSGRAFFHREDGAGLMWAIHAVEIPEPEIIPWTEETFPLDSPVWITPKAGGIVALITDYNKGGAAFSGHWLSYKAILDEYERVMPNRSIVPCGVVE